MIQLVKVVPDIRKENRSRTMDPECIHWAKRIPRGSVLLRKRDPNGNRLNRQPGVRMQMVLKV